MCITFLSYVLQIQSDAEDPQQQQTEFVTKSSELFDHVVYLAEVCDVLCIAMAELPNLLTPPEVVWRILLLRCRIVFVTLMYFRSVRLF